MHTMVRHDEVYNTRVLSNRYHHHFRDPFGRNNGLLNFTAFPLPTHGSGSHSATNHWTKRLCACELLK